MKLARRARTTQELVLVLVISVSLLVLGGEVVAHMRRMVHPVATKPVETTLTIPQMLQVINNQLDPATCPYLNAEHAKLLKAQLDDSHASSNVTERLNLEANYARELLNGGQTEEALSAYRILEMQARDQGSSIWQSMGPTILTREAIANLRLGEVQNCCASNNSYSCLLPITGPGIHTKQEGSRNAIKCLLQALQMDRGNVAARWLLNIAAMTIGEYPGKVPPQWLIPLKNFGGEYAMKKFFNAAPEMGLDFLGWAGGVAMEDFEGNGLLDLMISSIRPDGQLRYFHNNGDGTFTEHTNEAGIVGEVGGLNMITTDYNNDGKPDIIVLRGGWMERNGHYPLSLLRNDGNGHFTDVTHVAGLLSIGPTQTAVAFDYNGDGYLDLFVGYESTPVDRNPCKLFRNNGDGTFTDVTAQCGLDIRRYVKAVVSADFMHSGRPGLYLSCCGQPNILLRNDGPAGPDKSPKAPWKFTDITQQAGVNLQPSSFSCFFFDYDNDGWPDIFVVGYGAVHDVGDVAKDYLGMPTMAPKAKLYRNNHNGTFTDVTQQVHLDKVIEGMGVNFGDLDNDGWLDFYVGTGDPNLGTIIPNRMFRNHDGKYFDEVTTTGDFGHLQKGHGIAFGDINNNGQQDVFLVAGGALEGDTAHDCLYLNPGSSNHWITLKLEGVKSNRVAIGAEICVTAITPHGERKIYKTVSVGGSFGNNPLRQEIGLGDATGIKQVSIQWPASGIDQTLTGLQMDRFYKVREGDSSAEMWTVPTFKLKYAPAGANEGSIAASTGRLRG